VAKEKNLTGVQKAAILLISIGPERAASVLKQFPHGEIERISAEIANTIALTPSSVSSVYQEFLAMSSSKGSGSNGGIQYAKDLLYKALGSQSDEIIRSLNLQSKPFYSLRRIEPKVVANFLNGEHPQAIAMILSNLDPEQSAAILSFIPAEIQNDIAWRIATMEKTSPEIIKEVEAVLETRLSGIVSKDLNKAGGIKELVSILNMVDKATEKSIIVALETEDPELAEEVKNRLFAFEDIINIDDLSVRRILQEVDNKELALALKGANEEVSDKIFTNLSQRAGEMLKEDIDLLGPVRVREVEEKQKKIVQIIRRLDEAGQIVIARGGGHNDVII
jgi:flagellar motor switch protein FliG